jgi:hypothetical protein
VCVWFKLVAGDSSIQGLRDLVAGLVMERGEGSLWWSNSILRETTATDPASPSHAFSKWSQTWVLMLTGHGLCRFKHAKALHVSCRISMSLLHAMMMVPFICSCRNKK